MPGYNVHNKEVDYMSDYDMNEAQGKTTIDTGVLVEIARLAALSIPGVTGLAQNPQAVNNLFSKGYANGIKVDVENNTVYIDLYLTLANEANFYDTSQEVQKKVARSIIEMVGMDVGKINIHIEDITFD
jgi:uncharacterized alkaline shock family protein YloU